MNLRLTLFAAFAIGLGMAAAQDQKPAPNTLTEAEKKEGWKLLFDGKTAAGWKSWNSKEDLKLGTWVVEEGALTLSKKGGGDLYTAEAFENFEFSIDWKTTGNSGLFIRVNPEYGQKIWHSSPEMQVNTGKSEDKGSNSAGGLYALYDIKGEKVLHPEGWNTVKIRIENDKATYWFNGNKIHEFTIGSDDWNQRVADSKFKDHAENFATLKKGHIGVQDHGNKVMFRNIKIRALPEKE